MPDLDLDLSKAIEAGARVLTGQVLVSEYDDLNPQTRHAFDCDTERIIWAALPHILDALAEQAQDEADRKRISVCGQMQPHYKDAYARWLRAQAEEVRQ